MNETILKALMRLFAIIAHVDEEGVSSKSRAIVESYLKQMLNHELAEQYLAIFDDFIAIHHKDTKKTDEKKKRKKLSFDSVKMLVICEQINKELQQDQKIFVLLQLIEFICYGEEITEREIDFIETLASSFNISNSEYENCKNFVFDSIEKIPEKNKILIINNDKDFNRPEIKHIFNENLHGNINVLYINSTNTYAFRYTGKDNLLLNGQSIILNKTYILNNGSSIRSQKINTIYYSDIAGKFIKSLSEFRISFTTKDVIFKFRNSENGIQKLNFSTESGNLIGIIGGSGVGKSTLLNVLNGNLKPQSGKILINGYDLYSNKPQLKGVIGFIPQDDLLIDELTVYQNLYFNAKLCFNNLAETEINTLVIKTLKDLDLYHIRDLTVGNPLNKFISGGQRKRLNIALELIREPSVLLVDEPTSGLSSMDSNMVMDLLKEQTFKGKLVIINIHQPSSDIYKMFDEILIMDKGGYPIYFGDPIDAIVFFKTKSNYVNAAESQCITCGNVNPEQVLEIIEAKVVNENGKLTDNRKVTPKEWYELFQKDSDTKLKSDESNEKEELPKNNFRIPGLLKQLKIFTLRDVLSKLTNKQYLLISLLEAPLLALILGYFTKYICGTPDNPNAYIFSENINLPAYLFMCVIVSLFIGLTVSAEEIIKDREILKRESFLNLSYFSYINSKIIIMFALSVIQTISFILIGNYILDIKGLTLSYWLILFTTSCFANILGLNISSGFNSVVTVYIMIPFILVPQLLLSGVIVKFDKLHKNISSSVYVPFIGDLMTSRWAYEALAVNQFKNNKFQKNFFALEKEISNSSYNADLLIPKLDSKLNTCERNIIKKGNQQETILNLNIIKNEIYRLQKVSNIQYNYSNSLNINTLDTNILQKTRNYLFNVKEYFKKINQEANNKKDNVCNTLVKELNGNEGFDKLRQDYYNSSLADLVLNNQELTKIFETDNRLLQINDPVYKEPESDIGRAHFYSSSKIIFGKEIETFWFNTFVIWLTSIILYFTLYFDSLKKLLNFFEKFKFKTK